MIALIALLIDPQSLQIFMFVCAVQGVCVGGRVGEIVEWLRGQRGRSHIEGVSIGLWYWISKAPAVALGDSQGLFSKQGF